MDRDYWEKNVQSTIQPLGCTSFLTFWRGDHFLSGIIEKKNSNHYPIKSRFQAVPYFLVRRSFPIRGAIASQFGDHWPANFGIIGQPILGSFASQYGDHLLAILGMICRPIWGSFANQFGDHWPANLGIICRSESFTGLYRFPRWQGPLRNILELEKYKEAGTTIREGEGKGYWQQEVPLHLLVPRLVSSPQGSQISQRGVTEDFASYFIPLLI